MALAPAPPPPHRLHAPDLSRPCVTCRWHHRSWLGQCLSALARERRIDNATLAMAVAYLTADLLNQGPEGEAATLERALQLLARRARIALQAFPDLPCPTAGAGHA